MIFDVIYKLYFVLKRLMRNEKFNKNKLIKFIINIIQDIFNSKLPLYYKKNQDKIFLKRKNSNVKIIASLTTYPKRINTVWITINSIINQSLQPDSIILWLAEEQFPNKYEDLPSSLLQLQSKGLQIRFCEDLKSHKKYYYTLQEYSNDLVVLFDDDMFYPKDTIKKLYKLYQDNSHDVCTITTQLITPSIYTNPSKWQNPSINQKIKHCSKVQMFSGSGTLLKANMLDKTVFDKEAIKNICPYADDLWLTFMARKKGTKITSVSKWRPFPIAIYGTSEESLWYVNAEQGKNDEQWENLMKEYPKVFERLEREYDG